MSHPSAATVQPLQQCLSCGSNRDFDIQEDDTAAAVCCQPLRALFLTSSRKQQKHTACSCSVQLRSLPVAAQLAQRVVSHIKGMEARAAGNQPLDRGQFRDEVACQVQVLQLLQCCQGAHINDVAVLHC